MADTKFSSRQFGSWHFATPEFAAVFDKLRNAPLREDSRHHCINSNHGKTVWHCQDDGFDFAYKVQDAHPATRYLFKPSLCCREARNYLIVKELGIPCPEVLAVGDIRTCFILRETFIATKFLGNTRDGRAFMKGGDYATGHDDLKKIFCETHLKWLARLHDAGYYHKTFHARNLMFRENPGGKPEFFWIDMARMHKFTRKKEREIQHDLRELFDDLRLPAEEEKNLTDYYWRQRAPRCR